MTAPSPRRDYVVVVFGSRITNSHCDLSHCPMHAHGPYTRAEAEDVADRFPGWMQPHILTVAGNNDACLRTGDVSPPHSRPGSATTV